MISKNNNEHKMNGEIEERERERERGGTAQSINAGIQMVIQINSVFMKGHFKR